MRAPSKTHDCPSKQGVTVLCECPRCPQCGDRFEMHCPSRGCRVIVELRGGEDGENLLCGCTTDYPYRGKGEVRG